MADAPSDDDLRAMAQHRGLKLVKSRRRTPGSGDFGKFGLTDAAGKPLLGVGDDGLTAGAEEIEQYLRSSAAGTWKLSAETTPDRPPAKRQRAEREVEPEEPPVRRRPKPTPQKGSPQPPRAGKGVEANRDRGKAKSAAAPSPRPRPALRIVSAPDPEAPPVPKLRIRGAAAADVEAIASLLNLLAGVSLTPAETRANLALARGARAGVLVAERGALVGCCGWATVPTPHRGLMGRITALVVDPDHRRSGVATALLAAAEAALEKADCHEVEAMSDIMINNTHNFFRALGFEQVSYRFRRKISR